VIWTRFKALRKSSLMWLAIGLAIAFLATLWSADRNRVPLPMPPIAASLVSSIRAEVVETLTQTVGRQELTWVASGRYVPMPMSKGLHHEWPGLTVQARFSGESVLVDFDDTENRYRVLIDDEPVAMITRPGLATIRIDGLTAGDHVLRLEKLSESWESAKIVGISVPVEGAALEPAPLPQRRIDVFGDSDSVGYGNLSPRRICPGNDVFLKTDATRAWPATLAAHYMTVANVTARSGIGLVRNHSGVQPEQAMASLWERHLPSMQDAPNGPDFTPPWLTVVALGSNDFAVPLTAGERWPDEAALATDFSEALDTLLRELLRRAPGRPIVILAFADTGVPAHPLMRAVTEKLAAEGAPVTMVIQPKLGRSACHWHPSLDDHQALTDTLIRAIDTLIARGLVEAQ
jgi:hypothetical protein